MPAFLISVLILCLSAVGSAYAQDGRAKDFFSKGFAAQGGVGKKSDFFLKKDFAARPQTTGNTTSSGGRDDPNNSVVDAHKQTQPQSGMEMPTDSEAPKIEAIGMVIAGNAPAHLNQHLKDLIEFSQSRKIPVGTVYALGLNRSMNSLDQDNLSSLTKSGGSFQPVWTLPEHLPVTRSPSWILETDQGLVLLEGVPLLRYVTPNGKYADKGNGFTPKVHSSF